MSLIKAYEIETQWQNICEIIDSVPSYEELIEKYNVLGVKSSLADIGVPEESTDTLLEYSPLVRNRLTFMRIRRAIGVKTERINGSKIILAAHRGDQFNYPENTIPAFKSAIDFGVDMIETDVRMTKDGELVLIHDRSALRTAGIDKNIDEMTLAEVKKLNAGLTFKMAVKAEIPTVRELLELVKNKDVYINWELKVYPADFGDGIAFGIVDKLVDMINEYGVSERSVMNSFSAKVLEYIFVKYGDKFPIHGQGIYQCRRSKDFADIKEEEIFDWCCLYPSQPGFKAIDFKENFDYCIKNNILPCLCIPDTLEDYEIAIKYGCRMFTSNNIYEASRILKKLCKK